MRFSMQKFTFTCFLSITGNSEKTFRPIIAPRETGSHSSKFTNILPTPLSWVELYCPKIHILKL